ncbi:MAG: archease [Candidatus Poseidoniaceae archaeon]
MSSWMRPTTADVGLRSFAASKARLFEETTAGMQDYLLASEIPSKAIHHTSVWTVQIPVHDDSNGLLLVKWLEEVLFMDEVEQKWLVDCSIKIEELKGELSLQAHVRWVNSDEIEKEVEIKAVTRQDLMVAEVGANQTLESPWPEVPTFEGPGWYSDVVFDI